MQIFSFKSIFKNVDWLLFSAVFLISIFGLVTMNSFTGDSSFYNKQIIWLSISIIIFFISSGVDWSFLKNTKIIVYLFLISTSLLFLLFVTGSVFKGAKSWFDLGAFSFQPVDLVKIVIILLLSKYFSRRHVEIANLRHIIVSGVYVFIVFALVMLQPDFGSAIIIFFLWFGMVMVSGISKKHLLLVFTIGILSFILLWVFVFKPYQKARIMTFLNPLTDIRGTGYNAYQSTIAVGSGQILGKGIGYGTQSKLQFLPEYQTDFIFAAFAEEWGFLGVVLLLILYGLVFFRILSISFQGGTNFEILFGLGLVILFLTHSVIHIGMNIGLLPVTGNTLPFMSYGGSHLLAEFLGLGMVMGMRKNSRSVHKSISNENELVGVN